METKIDLSKSKLSLMFFGCILFVAGSIWFLSNPSKFSNAVFHSEIAIYIVGILGLVFFGICGFYIFKKMIDKNPGIIINYHGITDNSSGLSAGFIPWEDINAIEMTTITNQKFIVIILKNPENYIDKVKSKFKQRAMRINYKISNSPVNISANSLKINFNKLYELLNQSLLENNKNGEK
ncbi:STM3941 family protein [Halpernia sp.]|uniref:STM3941 family protein n=1 Tax=Halpernia sp. TaxID=2782209 RepID=UPI003A8D3C92